MRYAYAVTAALLIGGATATIITQQPVGAQVAQNAPGTIHAPVSVNGTIPGFADLVERLQPAVVNISTTQRVKIQAPTNPFAGTPFADLFSGMGSGTDTGRPITREAQSLGSGFIVSPDGYVVTNNHVISAGDPDKPSGMGSSSSAVVESITVTLPDHAEYKARIIGRDTASDLALLKIDSTKPLPFVQFGDSTRTRVGDWVLAIGNPFGFGGSVTAGIVSAMHRGVGSGPYNRYIQTDAAINQGNSGGPMFDVNGNVIGINTAIWAPNGGNIGIGFAIPAEIAKPVVDTLRSGKKVRHGYLGIAIQLLTDDIAAGLGLPKDHGEIVVRVEPGGPGFKAGIRQGDVLVKVNNIDVTPDNTLSYLVASQPVGAKVPIEVIRNGKHLTIYAVLAERPPEDQLAASGMPDNQDSDDDSAQNTPRNSARTALGLTLEAVTPEVAGRLNIPQNSHGLWVANVDPASDAAEKGLRRGDVILSMNERPVTSIGDAVAAITATKAAGRDTVLVLVQRGNNPPLFTGLKLMQNPKK
ncbi:MAG: Do family serine endopeptidase [Zymomonas mobilis subsp. pomaceae]|uniref:Probable periplasmic serine endoprotease DegP-like n=1 Tax=Zymomonas mobilis subsp. pomaceae (strain ATCC 29192 / DSM 22645 / JCM 10191 / CCUG 17912 / NBRC 13757 / NCIMB 11200 / NRRL B-4491 / Barker I) TaxID=579138 RepID=F8ESR0_ZYMMT|nr:Do family serine endopeptidase [Zymomonas mobilis]AEI37835.1 protease Do [Zymomonas mobilis subsp. pomaceae ATCC 29192]MDX5949202.1 Do family serine endopeptidase [Zymomonas mobilis subsp. pomaceae]GEB89570.1 serine protease [Zymomonas mobilis subsp. pomaceae]